MEQPPNGEEALRVAPPTRVLEIRNENSLDLLERLFYGYKGFRCIFMDMGEYALVEFGTELDAIFAKQDGRSIPFIKLEITFADKNRIRQIEERRRTYVERVMIDTICNILELSSHAEYEEFKEILRATPRRWSNFDELTMRNAFMRVQMERRRQLPIMRNEVLLFFLNPEPNRPLTWEEFSNSLQGREQPLIWYDDVYIRNFFETHRKQIQEGQATAAI